MVLCFDAMLYSNMDNENSGEDHIKCSRGPQVPHSWSTRIAWYFFLLCLDFSDQTYSKRDRALAGKAGKMPTFQKL